MDDATAIERYRYLLRTAPPHDIERAHAEAFAQLTSEQRRMVLRELGSQLPPAERASSDEPKDLARMATRAELRQPGILERTFGTMPAGPGLGGIFLSTLAGAFIGTAIGSALFDATASDASGNEAGPGDAEGADANMAGADGNLADANGDLGGADFGGGDFGDLGGDFGDFGV